MAITSTPSRGTSDNLRKFRRYLQGRGVNLRETIVGPFSPYVAETRLAVPGLHADDAIISVFDMDNLVDMTGYLDDGGDAATYTAFATTKGIVFTALRAGIEGNKIYVAAVAPPAADGAGSPLKVEIGDRDTLMGTSGNAGWTVIKITLASSTAGVADTVDHTSGVTGPNAALYVLDAVNAAQEAMIGDAVVDVALVSTGATYWTTLAAALTGGTSFNQGAAKASLSFTVASALDPDIRLVAREAGDEGNSITIATSENGALAVSVSGDPGDIVVEYDDGVTTAQEIVDAINADPEASALVIASIMPSNSSAGDDLAADDFTEDNLVGGLDAGIRMSTSVVGVKLKVMWLTRNDS